MKEKIIGIDLDGTLLTPDKRITERAKTAIDRATSQGIQVVPVTGRPFSGLPDAIYDLKGIEYAITSNGAVTYDLSTGSILKGNYLTSEICEYIYGIAASYDTIFEVFTNGKGYATEQTLKRLEQLFPMGHPLYDYIRKSRRKIDSMEALIEKRKDTIEGISIMCREKENHRKIVEGLRDIPGLSLSVPNDRDIEINQQKANKGDALGYLQSYLNINYDETFAIGDSDNDYKMLGSVKYPIAMKNAMDKLKSQAVWITDDNANDGVAKAVEKIIEWNC